MENQQQNPESYGTTVPPPPPSVHQAGYQKTERPVAATVVGVVLIIFGSLGVFGIISHFAMPDMYNSQPPAMRHQQLASTIVSMFTTPLTLVMGIGLLRMVRWARKGSVILLIAQLAITYIQMAIAFVYVIPALTDNASRIAASAGGVGAVIFNTIFLGLMLYFLTRPYMVEAYENRPGEYPISHP